MKSERLHDLIFEEEGFKIAEYEDTMTFGSGSSGSTKTMYIYRKHSVRYTEGESTHIARRSLVLRPGRRR